MNVEKRIFGEFLHRARERLSIESDAKQLRLIDQMEERLKKFLSERDFKFLSIKLRNKEKLISYALKNWKDKIKQQ